MGVAIADWMLLAGCILFGSLFTVLYGWAWSAPLHIFFLWPLCSRAQRGFENLTHEASHYNLNRSSPAFNDSAANWLCAYWVLISVELYRHPHIEHHTEFGSERDPDMRRFKRLDLDHIPWKSPFRLALYFLRMLPRYMLDYWGQFSSKKRQLTGSIILHVVFATLISLLIYRNFWLLWLAYFGITFLFYLPVLRFIAEAEEHRYLNAQSEFGSTFNNPNRFRRWLLHPHGDAYHLLHHMLPQIPHWKVAYAHRLLSAKDPVYQAGRSHSRR
jgi:fatty acid desaturase